MSPSGLCAPGPLGLRLAGGTGGRCDLDDMLSLAPMAVSAVQRGAGRGRSPGHPLAFPASPPHTACMPTPLTEASPAPGRQAWLNSLFVDHALLRLGWRNWGVVEPGRLYRSNHPLPWQLRAAAARLRPAHRHQPARRAERLRLGPAGRAAAADLGLVQVDAPFESRGAPHKDRILRLAEIFRTMRGTGADPLQVGRRPHRPRRRAVAAAAGPAAGAALAQLSLRHGHIRQSRTGILDAFFAALCRGACAGRQALPRLAAGGLSTRRRCATASSPRPGRTGWWMGCCGGNSCRASTEAAPPAGGSRPTSRLHSTVRVRWKPSTSGTPSSSALAVSAISGIPPGAMPRIIAAHRQPGQPSRCPTASTRQQQRQHHRGDHRGDRQPARGQQEAAGQPGAERGAHRHLRRIHQPAPARRRADCRSPPARCPARRARASRDWPGRAAAAARPPPARRPPCPAARATRPAAAPPVNSPKSPCGASQPSSGGKVSTTTSTRMVCASVTVATEALASCASTAITMTPPGTAQKKPVCASVPASRVNSRATTRPEAIASTPHSQHDRQRRRHRRQHRAGKGAAERQPEEDQPRRPGPAGHRHRAVSRPAPPSPAWRRSSRPAARAADAAPAAERGGGMVRAGSVGGGPGHGRRPELRAARGSVKPRDGAMGPSAISGRFRRAAGSGHAASATAPRQARRPPNAWSAVAAARRRPAGSTHD